MHAEAPRWIGFASLLGGSVAVLLAPVMVAIKYMTGWEIISEPVWVPAVRSWLDAAFPARTPAELWTAFGSGYSLAVLLMLVSLVGLRRQLEGQSPGQRIGYWLLTGGLALVLPGDAIHTWTWHQNGLTVPTPGSNPVANTAYATHMMGMNFIMVGSVMTGVAALRQRTLAPWLGWMLALTFPAALAASLVFLPTTPSGALWLFSILMALCGGQVARGRTARLRPA